MSVIRRGLDLEADLALVCLTLEAGLTGLKIALPGSTIDGLTV